MPELLPAADPGVTAFIGQVQDIAAARLAEAEHAARGYLGDVAALEPVARDELFRGLRDGQVLVLDVRPEDRVRHGHIPGAVNVPHDQLAARSPSSPPTPTSCLLPRPLLRVRPDAVRLLRASGFSAGRWTADCPTGAWPDARHRRDQRVTAAGRQPRCHGSAGPAAWMAPCTARPIRSAAWPGSGWPASSQAMTASVVSAGIEPGPPSAARAPGPRSLSWGSQG